MGRRVGRKRRPSKEVALGERLGRWEVGEETEVEGRPCGGGKEETREKSYGVDIPRSMERETLFGST